MSAAAGGGAGGGAGGKARTVVVFAEDLHPEHLAVVKTACCDVFDSPPVTGQLFGELARRIRAELDKVIGGRGWNVIVGRSFGAFVTHKIKHYAYLSVFPGVNVLVWKA
jgi:dynein light chain LC8-type